VGIAKDGADYTLLFGVPLSDNMGMSSFRIQDAADGLFTRGIVLDA